MVKTAPLHKGPRTPENGGAVSCGLPEGRLGFSVEEFSASFGHHHSWGYRQLYSGRVRKLDIDGRIIIPRSEIERLLSQTTLHGGAAA